MFVFFEQCLGILLCSTPDSYIPSLSLHRILILPERDKHKYCHNSCKENRFILLCFFLSLLTGKILIRFVLPTMLMPMPKKKEERANINTRFDLMKQKDIWLNRRVSRRKKWILQGNNLFDTETSFVYKSVWIILTTCVTRRRFFMAGRKEMDLTTGRPFGALFKFAIPVILGNLFQLKLK